MRLVPDASVAVKWVIRDPLVEAHADKALAILRAIRARRIEAIVPPHWMTEVLAVISRTRPQRVPITFGILRSFPFQETVTDVAYRRAANLAIQLQQHLFDTLYHAVALELGATLITADERYFAAAHRLGSITLLANFETP